MITSRTDLSHHWNDATLCTAFAGEKRLASGALADVVAVVKAALDEQADSERPLIFDDATARQIEVDLRGSLRTILNRLPKPPEATAANEDAEGSDPSIRKPGRPRLGVVPREVTLLPRHWEWLAEQPGGASVALRKLVEAARRANEGADRRRRSQEATHRFMTALAGDLPGYEEALRALYSGDAKEFLRQTEEWPRDVKAYAQRLATEALAAAD